MVLNDCDMLQEQKYLSLEMVIRKVFEWVGFGVDLEQCVCVYQFVCMVLENGMCQQNIIDVVIVVEQCWQLEVVINCVECDVKFDYMEYEVCNCVVCEVVECEE